MNILGIDPGLRGGIALLTSKDALGAPQIKGMPMPLTEEGIVDCGALVNVTEAFLIGQPTVYLEVVHAMPKQGVCSMFSFGKGYGQLIGMCQVKGWGVVFVRPRQWQDTLKPFMNMIKSDKWSKDHSIAFCDKHYPSISLLASSRCKKAHDGIADSLCIAHYGKLTEGII